MIETLKKFGGKKLGGLILIAVIIIAFGFGGFGGGFSTNNQNNIAKINKTNVTTQDFMNYLNQSGISQQAIRENLDNDIIEELLSGLISTTLIDLEVEDFNLSITELTVLKKIKENKNFQDENNIFKRTKYEKFLLSSNMSAPMFELQLKNRELQKHLFDFIGAGTITPDFQIKKMFEEENKSLELEYFAMENFYKDKESFTDQEINKFLDENKDQLKREYIDFKYAVLNPKILIGLEEFNQDFFDEIDKIENRISNGDNFLLYSITNKFDRGPDLADQDTKEEIRELVYQKGKFDLNRSVLEEIQNKKFDDNRFKEMAGYSKEYLTINSIRDNNRFEANSVKILYSLPLNSYTLVNDKENKIYLVKLVNSQKNSFSETDENYLNFVNNQNTNTRKTILQSYDQLLNSKYQVQLNQKTIDRVKNYFK